jgi:hypothetical protein
MTCYRSMQRRCLEDCSCVAVLLDDRATLVTFRLYHNPNARPGNLSTREASCANTAFLLSHGPKPRISVLAALAMYPHATTPTEQS